MSVLLVTQNIIDMKKEEWNPGYCNKDKEFVPYEKRWYCNENKTIHQNIKEKDNCKYCNSK